MAITYGFYNSVAGDRVYDATQFSKIFDGILYDGVFMAFGDAMMVVPSTGLSISVGVGRAWFNHTWTYNDAALVLTIGNPNGVYPRIDTIALDIDSSEGVRANNIVVVQGVAGTNPVPPTLYNTETHHQYPLAYISVPVGLVTITNAEIQNMVGTTLCPFVTGPLQSISTEQILAEWEAQFMVWFNEMKDQLSQDAAGNLQLQIDALELFTEHTSVLPRRQGYLGSMEDWTDPGSNGYDVTRALMFVGSIAVSGGAGQISVTFPGIFPEVFTFTPIVFLSPISSSSAITGRITAVDSSGFTAIMTVHTTTSPYHIVAPNGTVILWLAIGAHG